MDLNIFVKNVYIILLSPAYKNITFYGSSHSSHEILTNWSINVDNFVQRQSALLNILNIQLYLYTIHLYIFFNKEVGRGIVELLLCFLGGPYPSEVWEALVYSLHNA